jgi:hypothetical protein
MDPLEERLRSTTRRLFLRDGALSLGAIALASLLRADSRTDDGRPLAERPGRLPPRAKNVIFLHLAGAPPQLDLFDYKPKLNELHGTLCPNEFIEGKRLAFIKGHPTLLGCQQRFVRQGESGQWVSELLPHFGPLVDRVAMIRSMHTDQFNHAPADLLLHTGNAAFGAASMGSWVTWGLGSPNQDLPGFVVLVTGGSDPTGGKSTWGSGFLPSAYQGVRLRSKGEPILYVSDPGGVDRGVRRRSLDALRELNERELAEEGDPEIRARIEQYELAYRMQASVPEVMDIRRESPEMLEMYGARPGELSFANSCLLARRLVEAGVRYVQLFDWGWDIHGTGPGDDLLHQFPMKCKEVDRPMAALLIDLERRGLLDETLLVWCAEFGRTSMNEARDGSTYLGRDHHPDCFTAWLAGAGIHRGLQLGATDELGYTIVDAPVHVHDLQATILHLVGLDPENLRYSYLGLDQRLIGPAEGPRVVRKLFA